MAARHGGKDREIKRLLRRDNGFKAQLSRAYGVEKAPKGVSGAIDKAIASLPEDMPSRHRPVLRVVKSFAACAALVALVFAGLLGLNTTYPQLTEALPGLGPVFAAINGGKTPHPPTDSSEQLDETEDAGLFQPVTAKSHDAFIGDMTITSAWSDGRSLIMQLELEASQKMWDMHKDWMALYGRSPVFELHAGDYIGKEWDSFIQSPEAEAGYPQVKVESGGESCTGQGVFSALVFNDDGNITGTWRVDLSNMERLGSELEVLLSLPFLAVEEPASVNYEQMLIEPNYEASFTVPVDSSRNRTVQGTAIDNGSTLYSVEYSPGRIELTMAIPCTGYLGDMMLGVNGLDGQDAYSPLNIYGELETVSRSGGGIEYELDSMDKGLDGKLPADSLGELMYYTYVFRPAAETPLADLRKDPGVLRLTLYETPDAWPGMFRRRVGSQFRIDLSTGRISASKDYLEQGLERSDIEAGPTARLEEAWASNSGIACIGVELAVDGSAYYGIQPYAKVVLAADSADKLRGLYVGAETESNSWGEYALDGPMDGQELIADARIIEYSLPSCGKACWVMEAELFYPEWLLADSGYRQTIQNPYRKLMLIGQNDGLGYEGIFMDLEQAWIIYAGKAIGGLEEDALIDLMQSIISPLEEAGKSGLPERMQGPEDPSVEGGYPDVTAEAEGLNG